MSNLSEMNDLLFETLNQNISFDFKTKILKTLMMNTKLKYNEMLDEAIFGDENVVDKLSTQVATLAASDIIPFKVDDNMISMTDCVKIHGKIRRRKEALELACAGCPEMLETINKRLINLKIDYGKFDLLHSTMSKGNFEVYVNFIRIQQRDLEPHKFNSIKVNDDMMMYFKINSEILQLRSLYQVLFGLDAMVKFFKPLAM